MKFTDGRIVSRSCPEDPMAELTFTTAFIAGIVSFISPCELPLAPGYVAMISGVSVEQLQLELVR